MREGRELMEKDSCWRWFRYAPEDAKAAQAELDRLADQGLELDEIGLFCMKFRRTGRPRRCWVEPARWRSARRKDETRRAEYLELCGEAGWELVDEANGLFYFRAMEGRSPAPVQTDESVEWETVLRKALWDRGINLVVVTVLWAINFFVRFVYQGFHPWEVLLSNSTMVLLVFLLAWLVIDVLHGAYVLRYRGRCRRAAEQGEPFPVPDRTGARVRGCLGIVTVLLIAAILLSALAGAGEQKQSGDLAGVIRYETTSVFARHTEYLHFGTQDRIQVDEYDCRYLWLAEAICRGLIEDEGDEKRVELHFHDPATPEPAALPFDEAWRYDAGGRTGLILRQGSRTVRVECSDDLGEPDSLEEIWALLGLEEIP